jgi:hypothetical protein
VDLSLSSYLQYGTDTDAIGINTRLRWTFRPFADTSSWSITPTCDRCSIGGAWIRLSC